MRYKRFKDVHRCTLCGKPAPLNGGGAVSRDGRENAHVACLLEAHRTDAADGMCDVFRLLGHEDMIDLFRAAILAEGLPWGRFIALIEAALHKMSAAECENRIQEISRNAVLAQIAEVFSGELMVDIRYESPHSLSRKERRLAEEYLMN